MVVGSPAASKNRDGRWLPRAAATTLGVVLLVVSTAEWLYLLGKIGRATFEWISA
jgi:predicted cobalt transporter CbtA